MTLAIFAAAFAQKVIASAALVAVLWLIVVLIDRYARGESLPFFGEDDGRIRWKTEDRRLHRDTRGD